MDETLILLTNASRGLVIDGLVEELFKFIDVLYNEECDAWLALRKYELAGLSICD